MCRAQCQKKDRVFKEVALWLQHPEQDKSGQADRDPAMQGLVSP